MIRVESCTFEAEAQGKTPWLLPLRLYSGAYVQVDGQPARIVGHPSKGLYDVLYENQGAPIRVAWPAIQRQIYEEFGTTTLRKPKGCTWYVARSKGFWEAFGPHWDGEVKVGKIRFESYTIDGLARILQQFRDTAPKSSDSEFNCRLVGSNPHIDLVTKRIVMDVNFVVQDEAGPITSPTIHDIVKKDLEKRVSELHPCWYSYSEEQFPIGLAADEILAHLLKASSWQISDPNLDPEGVMEAVLSTAAENVKVELDQEVLRDLRGASDTEP